MHTLESDLALQDPKRMSTPTTARPAFGTVLADQMAIAKALVANGLRVIPPPVAVAANDFLPCGPEEPPPDP